MAAPSPNGICVSPETPTHARTPAAHPVAPPRPQPPAPRDTGEHYCVINTQLFLYSFTLALCDTWSPDQNF